MWEVTSDLGTGGDAYPGEMPDAEAHARQVKRDYSDGHKQYEHPEKMVWSLVGNEVKIGHNYPEAQAQGTLTVHHNWNVDFQIMRTEISTKELAGKLKAWARGENYQFHQLQDAYGNVVPWNKTAEYPGIGDRLPGIKDWKNLDADKGGWSQEPMNTDYYGFQNPTDDSPLNFQDQPTQCPVCKRRFPNESEYVIHLMDAHPDADTDAKPIPPPVADLDQPLPAHYDQAVRPGGTVGEPGINTGSVKKSNQGEPPWKFFTTPQQFQEALALFGPVLPHNQKHAAADPEYLNQWRYQNGDYLYHGTHPTNIVPILQNGILPWNESGNFGGYMEALGAKRHLTPSGLPSATPRHNHAYIGTDELIDEVPHFHGPWIRADLRQLDPRHISANEETLHKKDEYDNEEYDEETGEWREKPSFLAAHGLQPWDKTQMTQGQWGDLHANVVDDPKMIPHSLEDSMMPSLAVRGGVPAHAISMNPRTFDHIAQTAWLVHQGFPSSELPRSENERNWYGVWDQLANYARSKIPNSEKLSDEEAVLQYANEIGADYPMLHEFFDQWLPENEDDDWDHESSFKELAHPTTLGQANYQPATGPENCGNCKFFMRHTFNENLGRCTMFKKTVEPKYVCSEWTLEPRTELHTSAFDIFALFGKWPDPPDFRLEHRTAPDIPEGTPYWFHDSFGEYDALNEYPGHHVLEKWHPDLYIDKNYPNHRGLINAWSGKNLVGSLKYQRNIEDFGEDPNEIYVPEMAVHPDYRETSAGMHMMRELAKTYPDKRIDAVALPEKLQSIIKRYNDRVDKQIMRQQQLLATSPKIPGPIPFLYDTKEDKVYVGHPGDKAEVLHTHPGYNDYGAVEGYYMPNGEFRILETTNMPITVRHLVRLWYYMHPELEVKRVVIEYTDTAGKKRKERLAAVDITQHMHQALNSDPAANTAAQALLPYGNVYIVGGAVRDAALGTPSKDVDLMAQGIKPHVIERVLQSLPGRVDFTGKQFGVFRYRTPEGFETEIALPRTERSTGEGHKDFEIVSDPNLPVESDLARRDFTGNAIAYDIKRDQVIDPFGGWNDLQDRKLKTVSPDSFRDDPLRILRGLGSRSRHGLVPDEQTRQQMMQHAPNLKHLPQERVQAELDKIMGGKDPAAAMRLAQETGALQHILPEVARTHGFDQRNKYHNLELFDHTMAVLDHLAKNSSDKDLRYAGLLHDIGKPDSQWIDDEGWAHYYQNEQGQGLDHETAGAGLTSAALKRLKFPNDRAARITHLVQHHMFPPFQTAAGARKFVNRVGDEHANDLLQFRRADMAGKPQFNQEVDQMQSLVDDTKSKQYAVNKSSLDINGNDLIKTLGIKPGPQIGQILDHLLQLVLENPNYNTKEQLLSFAQQYANPQ